MNNETTPQQAGWIPPTETADLIDISRDEVIEKAKGWFDVMRREMRINPTAHSMAECQLYDALSLLESRENA